MEKMGIVFQRHLKDFIVYCEVLLSKISTRKCIEFVLNVMYAEILCFGLRLPSQNSKMNPVTKNIMDIEVDTNTFTVFSKLHYL